jgi:hypothetical protein
MSIYCNLCCIQAACSDCTAVCLLWEEVLCVSRFCSSDLCSGGGGGAGLMEPCAGQLPLQLGILLAV